MATVASTSRTEVVDGGGPPEGGPAARPNAVIDGIEQVAGMMTLAWRTVVAIVTPPFSWKADLVEETWLILRRCFIPVVLATLFFGFGAPGIQGGNITNVFGTVDRLGAFFVMASVREFAPWINGMVIAGVAGTAIC